MPALLIIFLVVSLLTSGLALALDARQSSYVLARRGAVPPAFADSVRLDEHQRAADYERARLRIGAAETVISFAIGVAWAVAGYDALYGWVAQFIGPSLTRSVLFLLAASAVGWLLNLPFQIIRTFGVEKQFGFNRTTPASFVWDRVKAGLISLALAIPLLYGMMALMRLQGFWWAWAWAGMVALMFAMMQIYPRWIAPLFNKFTPLEGSLRTRIEGLLQRCGFEAAGLFVMDASRRSAHGNAYFSGLGRSKRIVLFDTLIEKNSEAELEAVLAHELGHFKLKHIMIGLLQSTLLLFVGFFIVGWLCRQSWLLPSFGISHRDDALALIVCVLVVQMAGPLLGVLGNWISRKHEYQADDFARRMVGAEPMISALVRLSRDNASTLTPDPLYALVNFSHPPVPLRVQRLGRLAQA